MGGGSFLTSTLNKIGEISLSDEVLHFRFWDDLSQKIKGLYWPFEKNLPVGCGVFFFPRWYIWYSAFRLEREKLEEAISSKI